MSNSKYAPSGKKCVLVKAGPGQIRRVIRFPSRKVRDKWLRLQCSMATVAC